MDNSFRKTMAEGALVAAFTVAGLFGISAYAEADLKDQLKEKGYTDVKNAEGGKEIKCDKAKLKSPEQRLVEAIVHLSQICERAQRHLAKTDPRAKTNVHRTRDRLFREVTDPSLELNKSVRPADINPETGYRERDVQVSDTVIRINFSLYPDNNIQKAVKYVQESLKEGKREGENMQYMLARLKKFEHAVEEFDKKHPARIGDYALDLLKFTMKKIVR